MDTLFIPNENDFRRWIRSWPFWIIVRLSYLILVPAAFWFLLKWIWALWQPNPKEEFVLERILLGLIGIGSIIVGVSEGTVNKHWGNAMICFIIGFFVIAFGAIKKRHEESDSNKK